MANAGTRITTAAENPLCGRLKDKYSGRIAAACDPRRETVQRRPVSAREAAARKIATPFEDTMEFVPARAKAQSNAKPRSNNARPSAGTRGAVRTDAAQRRVAAYEKTTPFSTGAFSEAYRRAADIRARAYDGSEAMASKKREADRRRASAAPRILSKKWFSDLLEGRNDEVRVKSSPISKSAIVAILLVAAIVLMIIFSLSEINSFKQDISSLESQRAELKGQIEQLYLDIDRKNDVRTIEQVATEDIGMVKSNQVESKYISLFEGDRVEVVSGEDKETENYGIFSTLLSTFGSNWETLRDYID
ncbi:MAG: hypothetical protein PUC29_07610 [Clostridia bacterium]|nr:hypothetical protein [Clostridia bacterium]